MEVSYRLTVSLEKTVQHQVEQKADDICLSNRRKLQAPAMDSGEVVLP